MHLSFLKGVVCFSLINATLHGDDFTFPAPVSSQSEEKKEGVKKVERQRGREGGMQQRGGMVVRQRERETAAQTRKGGKRRKEEGRESVRV